MPNDRAKEIIQCRNQEQAKVSGFWHNIWQDSADLCFPCQDQISSTSTPGEDQSVKRYDDTGVRAREKMASGMLTAFMPAGKKFFGIKLRDRELSKIDHVRRWLSGAATDMHYELFDSNFRQQFSGALSSGIAFGTGCIFSEFNLKLRPLRLNFRDYAINLYTFKENFAGQVDTIYLSVTKTARQIVQEFSDGTISEDIQKAANDPAKESKKFDVIYYVGPRKEYVAGKITTANMPFEMLVIDVAGQSILQTTGFVSMPFHVFRWAKRANEKWGRGPGVDCLADLRMLQAQKAAKNALANKQVNPPLMVNSNFPGLVDMRPGAMNRTDDVNNTVKGLDPYAIGNSVIAKDEVEAQQLLIRQAFYNDVFAPITDLTGDRRTTVEIEARKQEGLRQLGAPVGMIESELLNPLLERVLELLVTYGRIPPMPTELVGQQWNFEYTGQLALALRDQQASGFMRFASFGAQIAEIAPEALDRINFDSAMPDMAESMGVSEMHVATDEEVAAKRETRAKQQAAVMAMQAAQAGGKAYKDASGAPEAGSPAEELMGAKQ